jgi:hypothetical protein
VGPREGPSDTSSHYHYRWHRQSSGRTQEPEPFHFETEIHPHRDPAAPRPSTFEECRHDAGDSNKCGDERRCNIELLVNTKQLLIRPPCPAQVADPLLHLCQLILELKR